MEEDVEKLFRSVILSEAKNLLVMRINDVQISSSNETRPMSRFVLENDDFGLFFNKLLETEAFLAPKGQPMNSQGQRPWNNAVDEGSTLLP